MWAVNIPLLISVELWSSHKAPSEENPLVETRATSHTSISVNVVVFQGLKPIPQVRKVMWVAVNSL